MSGTSIYKIVKKQRTERDDVSDQLEQILIHVCLIYKREYANNIAEHFNIM